LSLKRQVKDPEDRGTLKNVAN